MKYKQHKSPCGAIGVFFCLFFGYALRGIFAPSSFEGSFVQREKDITDLHEKHYLNDFISFYQGDENFWAKWPETMKKAQYLAEKNTFEAPYGIPHGHYNDFFQKHCPQTVGGWLYWARKFSTDLSKGPNGDLSSHEYKNFQEFLKYFWQETPLDSLKERRLLELCKEHLEPEDIEKRVWYYLWSKESKKALSLWEKIPGKRKELSVIMGILKKNPKLTPEILLKEKPFFPSSIYEFLCLRTLIRFGRGENSYESQGFRLWHSGILKTILNTPLKTNEPLERYRKEAIGDLEISLGRSLLNQGLYYSHHRLYHKRAQGFFKGILTLGYDKKYNHGKGRDITGSRSWYDLCFLKGLAHYGGLKEPQKAIKYFLTIALEGQTKRESEFFYAPPLTLQQIPGQKSRAWFFAGLCYEVMGQMSDARKCWSLATQWPFSFYGQMAHFLLHKKYTPYFYSYRKPSEIAPDTLGRKAIKWTQKGRSPLNDVFLKDLLSSGKNPEDYLGALYFSNFFTSQDTTFVAQRILYLSGGRVVFQEAYPLLTLPGAATLPWDKQCWIHGLILQETCFRASSLSSAGALGLMQLLPSVAKEIASSLGHSSWSLKEFYVPKNNILLGRTFFEKLIKKCNKSHMEAVGAYNGGLNRIKRWKNLYPAHYLHYKIHSALPVEKWIWLEAIPIEETRNYIKRVVGHYIIYRYLMGHSVTLEEIKKIL